MTKKEIEELYCMAKRIDITKDLYSSEWLIVNKYTDIFPKDKEYKQEPDRENPKLLLTDYWEPVAYEELVDWNLK